MNTLLLFFALPIATVLLAIVLQKILKCPLLVAATFFAIYLIVTFAAFDASFLVYAILYTILAYVTAVLTKLICRLIQLFLNNNNGRICNDNNDCTYHENNGCTCGNNSENTITRVAQRPITINNTSPCTRIELTNDANLLTGSNLTARRRNNCNCCRRT